MTIESSLNGTGANKKSQFEWSSSEFSSNTKGSFQGDSDSECTSVTSSMQGSSSSATSSLDQDSTQETKTTSKSNPKKLMTYGSFMSSRRRGQSRLAQSSTKFSSTTNHPSSVEASDESPDHLQKPMPKFTRTGSLRTVKLFRNKSKSSSKTRKSLIVKNSEDSEELHLERATFSSTLKDSKFPEQLKVEAGPHEPEEILPVAKICPYQHCSLHGHHHHHHEPPKKCFTYLKRRTTKDQKSVNQESQSVKSRGKKKEVKATKTVSKEEPDTLDDGIGRKENSAIGDNVDDSIEFYAKTRSDPLIEASRGHDDADFADILFGVNSFGDNDKDVRNSRTEDQASDAANVPRSNLGSSIDLKDEKNGNSDESNSILEKKAALKNGNHISMWQMIHRHMVSGLTAEPGNELPLQVVEKMQPDNEDADSDSLPWAKDFDNDNAVNRETEIRKMFAIKLVREAIEKILLPEVQDDQSTTSEAISELDVSEMSQARDEICRDRKEAADDVPVQEKIMEEKVEKKPEKRTCDVSEKEKTMDEQVEKEPEKGTHYVSEKEMRTEEKVEEKPEKRIHDVSEKEKKPEKRTPKSWSYLKKVILLGKFVKELEKIKKFDPKKPRHLPLVPEPESDTVSLRRQTVSDKKNADEWMLDYALQKVVSELAPTQKRKVALLVKAFETVAPTHEDQHTNVTTPKGLRSNTWLQRVSSETNDNFQKLSDSTSFGQLTAAGEENKKERKHDFSDETAREKQLDKEKRIKMWHMIYQHVATDIATKVGSTLLLDGDESVSGEDKNFEDVEDHIERKYRLGFTQSDAVKLVRESVDEILVPEDARSIASDIASDQDEFSENKDLIVDGAGSKVRNVLKQQKSENWSKLRKLILLRRSIKALESFRKLKPQTPQPPVSTNDPEGIRVDLRSQMTEERKKAEQWMLDYTVQHIVTKLTPARKKRVSMLVEAFEAVVPLPET